MTTLKVGDKVIRKHQSNVTGTIVKIWPVLQGDKRGRLRAEVRWHGANRYRLGATTADKYGRIMLDALAPAPAGQ